MQSGLLLTDYWLLVIDLRITVTFSQIGWYNDHLLRRHKASALPHPYDTLGLVVISTPLMFDNGFKPFIRQSSCTEGGDALDQFMTHVYNKGEV